MSAGIRFPIDDPDIYAEFGIYYTPHRWLPDDPENTYIDHVFGFGYNMHLENPSEPALGWSLEQHFMQAAGQPKGVEAHLAATFPDGGGSRMITYWVDYDYPHKARGGMSGEVTFTDSHGGDAINARIREGGGSQWWAGTGVTNLHDFYSRAYTESVVGGGGIRISPSDRYPAVHWMGGIPDAGNGHYSAEASIFLDRSPEQYGWMFVDLAKPGAELHVRGAKTLVVDNGALQTAAPSGGIAAPWKLGSIVPVSVVMDSTRYVTAEVGGITCKLALCQE